MLQWGGGISASRIMLRASYNWNFCNVFRVRIYGVNLIIVAQSLVVALCRVYDLINLVNDLISTWLFKVSIGRIPFRLFYHHVSCRWASIVWSGKYYHSSVSRPVNFHFLITPVLLSELQTFVNTAVFSRVEDVFLDNIFILLELHSSPSLASDLILGLDMQLLYFLAVHRIGKKYWRGYVRFRWVLPNIAVYLGIWGS